jgi:hypothetical protein
MVGRGQLTEEAWSVIAPLQPAIGRRGGQWRNHRTGKRSRDVSTPRYHLRLALSRLGLTYRPRDSCPLCEHAR